MTGLLPLRRTRSTSDSRLIPMINVVFLLLIFFMIAGQISALNPGAVQLPLASSGLPPPAAELHLRLAAMAA